MRKECLDLRNKERGLKIIIIDSKKEFKKELVAKELVIRKADAKLEQLSSGNKLKVKIQILEETVQEKLRNLRQKKDKIEELKKALRRNKEEMGLNIKLQANELRGISSWVT